MPRCPKTMRPVKPEPMATATRPGAQCARAAIAAAFGSGCRRLGTSTAGAKVDAQDVRWREARRVVEADDRARDVDPLALRVTGPRDVGRIRHVTAHG